MQTFADRLTAYCTRHNHPEPYGTHVARISHAVINAIKTAGKYDLVTKKDITIEMNVNNYPEELLPIVDDTIAGYFTRRQEFFKTAGLNHPAKFTGKFNYELESYKVAAFEKALVYCRIPVQKNEQFGSSSGKVQYIIPFNGPAQLIALGKRFQKERYFEKKNRYFEKKNRMTDP